MNPDTRNKILTLCKTKGERPTAMALVNASVKNLTGGFPTVHDLPDTATLCNGLDEIQALLESLDIETAWTLAKETAEEMLAEEGFPLEMAE